MLLVEFTQMYKNQKVCDIRLTDEGCKVIKRYPDVQPYKLMFPLDEYSYKSCLAILESRLWDKCHEEYSRMWNVDREDIIACVRKTHGVLLTDRFWFQFTNESLRWEDVYEENTAEYIEGE